MEGCDVSESCFMAHGRRYHTVYSCFNRYLLNQQLHARDAHSTALPHASNLYDVLKVPIDATAQEIKDSYYTLSRQYHPDMNSDRDCAETTQKFQELNSAYQILGNEAKRVEYDRKLLGYDGASSSGQPFGTSRYEMDSEQMKDYMEFRRRFRNERTRTNAGFDFPNYHHYAGHKGPGGYVHWNTRGYNPFGDSWAENANNFARQPNSAFENYVRRRKQRQAEEEMKLSVVTLFLLIMSMLLAAGSVPMHSGPRPPW